MISLYFLSYRLLVTNILTFAFRHFFTPIAAHIIRALHARQLKYRHIQNDSITRELESCCTRVVNSGIVARVGGYVRSDIISGEDRAEGFDFWMCEP